MLDSFQNVRGFRGVLGNPKAYRISQRVAYPPLRLCTEKFSLGPFLSSLVTQEPSVRIGFGQPPTNETSGPLTVIDGTYLPRRDILGMISPEELHYEKPEGVHHSSFPPRIVTFPFRRSIRACGIGSNSLTPQILTLALGCVGHFSLVLP